MQITNGLVIFDPGYEEGPCSAGSVLPSLPEADRKAFHDALFHDAVDRFHGFPGAVVTARFCEAGMMEALRETWPSLHAEADGHELVEARLSAAIEEQFEHGARRLLVLFPTAAAIPMRVIDAAFTLLDTFDDAVVIGPTEGGDTYAIGLRWSHPEIPAAFPGGSVHRLDRILRCLSCIESTLHMLQSWYDLRTPADFARLAADLDADTSGYRSLRVWAATHPSLFLSPQESPGRKG
ncbi:MAG: hypothetical protein QHI48_01090 [Bacteroidota bacterium]|nr:hypothetical protein [Bacteroidota bacterium]